MCYKDIPYDGMNKGEQIWSLLFNLIFSSNMQ